MADPVFLITGASSGIGEATARHASAAGYRLVLAARREERLQGARRRARRIRPRARGALRRGGVGRPAAPRRAALEAFGRIDVVFANAGFGAPRGFTASDPEHWRSMVLTNVLGPAFTIRATAAALKESRGHLLITGSVAGRRAIAGSLYSATKWAVTGMGEAARQEFNDTGVRVTLIEPGSVDTPFFDEPPTGALEPDDIARAVLFAVSQPPHVDVNELLIRPTAQSN